MQTKAQIISEVLKTRRYAAVAVVGSIGLGIIYYLLTMAMIPMHIEAGVMEAEPAYLTVSIALTVAVSTIAGINFALMAYKIKRNRMMSPARSTKSNITTIFAGVFAVFTPGCPGCTAPLVVILSAVGGLSLFPMYGLELKMVSAGVLLFSMWWITKGLQSKSCCKIG